MQELLFEARRALKLLVRQAALSEETREMLRTAMVGLERELDRFAVLGLAERRPITLQDLTPEPLPMPMPEVEPTRRIVVVNRTGGRPSGSGTLRVSRPRGQAS